ncbi:MULTISPECIES: rhodanese-like domain-containing protein [unclassified Paludibacterium]|uniref:rhodanese-like domain-containing protein n=1 Tax=unclassified Paludibacterium TaxID=2618429 RepID=UPI001C03F835|nr:rhodanese-like domain-containing protein [Paludibacterium sp. B53371]BEV72781.1 rhodanese-like domain-containing protein [Paludibacterium sp. THUN1379]
MAMEITCEALAARLNSSEPAPLLLDVREDWEWQMAHIEGSVHLPMNLIPLRHNELPDDRLIVTVCHHGMRSLQVCHFLRQVGFDQVLSLHGGIDAWSATIDDSVPRY